MTHNDFQPGEPVDYPPAHTIDPETVTLAASMLGAEFPGYSAEYTRVVATRVLEAVRAHEAAKLTAANPHLGASPFSDHQYLEQFAPPARNVHPLEQVLREAERSGVLLPGDLTRPRCAVCVYLQGEGWVIGDVEPAVTNAHSYALCEPHLRMVDDAVFNGYGSLRSVANTIRTSGGRP